MFHGSYIIALKTRKQVNTVTKSISDMPIPATLILKLLEETCGNIH